MYKLCKTEQSSARQRELEMGLLELMQQQRYENISVSELCDKIQIPRKSFYRYFSSKDGALFALLDHTMMEFQMSDLPATQRTARADLERFFQFWYDHKSLLDVLARSNLSGILVERATALALQERMMPRQLLELKADIRSVAMSFAVCGIMAMVISWHSQDFRETPAEMTHIATSLLSKPLLSIEL